MQVTSVRLPVKTPIVFEKVDVGVRTKDEKLLVKASGDNKRVMDVAEPRGMKRCVFVLSGKFRKPFCVVGRIFNILCGE